MGKDGVEMTKEEKAAKKAKKEAKRALEAAEEERAAKKAKTDDDLSPTKEGKEEKAAKKAAKEEKKAKKEGKAAKATEAAPAADADAGFTTFAATPFAPAVKNALSSGYSSPTSIQTHAWPAALTGRDLIAIAKTGSGKTLAFLLPLLHQGERFGKLLGVPTAVVYGGTPVREQKAALLAKPPSLLVATPGRLVDLLDQQLIWLGDCKAIVLDEADRLLDMGFEPQLKKTFSALPEARQTLLFSATWPKTVPVSQAFVHATDDEKDAKLYQSLCELEEGARVIVFANTKRRVDNLAKTFAEFGTCAIHGDKQQKDRESALAAFIANKAPLMVATDVAARGLDIKLVTHVYNYDMARDVESYVHRIGRTGRAGALGKAITFWNPDYDKECAPALIRIARKAGQPVPDWLAKHENAKATKLWNVDKADKEAEALLMGA
ncbi:dead deah box [Chrysochromulina tobinii]|uniref:RNA helicase n=1 Tax=Chrysochromulina tobinii TaxID=1460289 RepID=A0A0M0K2C6_9EUKA|nr:dead deah box [Chrysochromulina tobinii]|eukprot:KOO32954.1 dead deah box [Chrysochromulina sp. CCMP291]